MSNEIVLADGEVIEPMSPGALAEITKAEVFQQIETARRYRRNFKSFMDHSIAMVSYSPVVASKFQYVLPKKDRDGNKITGVSIHGAKMMASAWGNLRIGGRVVSEDDRFVTAQGVCQDLETNVTFCEEVKVPIRDAKGRRYSEDMIKNACGSAISKAVRNAILAVIPPAFVQIIADEATKVARGDSKSLPDRIHKAVKYFGARGISERRVYDALGISGVGDATLDHVASLQGFKTALEEGINPEEIFPMPVEESRSAALNRSILEKKNGGRKPEEQIIDVQEAAEVVIEEEVSREPGEDG